MSFKRRSIFCPLLAVSLWLAALGASAQTLTFSNGVQTYASLSNTVVTMTGQCELIITGTNNPISGSTINLNSSNAWVVLSNIRPSAVSANYLSQILVNGATASSGSNCRLVEYVMGTAILPHKPSITPMTIFSGPNFTGPSAQLSLYTYYNTSSSLGALYRNIDSFKLKRGYMATLAQNTDGTGVSQVFVAQDGDIEVSLVEANLNVPVSMVRVVPWSWTGKKGWVGGVSTDTTLIDPLWNYDYDNVTTSTLDIEYVPMRDTAFWDAYSNINSKQGSTEAVGFNEPDQANQANMTVAAAIAQWPSLMQSGLRIGAPAVSSSGVAGQGLSWLYSFMSQATNLGYRIDYVPVHLYQCSWTTAQFSNYLAGVYHTTGRPVWVTEFNDTDFSSGCSQTQSSESSAIGGYISMMESCPFVERYSVYEYFDPSTSLNLVTTNSPAALTPAGQVYHNQQSTMAYTQTLPSGGNRGIAEFQFETNMLDSSGYGNNAFAVGIPNYVPGHTGQAVALDGTNTYLMLPPTVGQSNAFTFAAWVYWNGGVSWQRIFDFGDDTSHYMFLTPSSGSGTLRFAINNGSGEQTIQTTTPLTVGQWQHVAITLSSGSAKIYTNGVLAVTASITTLPSNFTPIKNYLGKSQFPADPLFSGSLDEVQIADTVMTAAQIAALQTDSPPQYGTNFLSRGTAAPFVAFTTNVTGTATDPDAGDSVTYSKASGPAWLTVGSTGTLSGTPGSGDGGTNYFTVRATDTAGASAYAVASVIVPITYGNGTWGVDAAGSWDDGTKWTGSAIANGGNGANYTADFSTLNITADRSVSVDSPRSIGNLKFGDTSGSQNWLLTSSGANTLTLDTGSTTQPTIIVNQNNATIAAALINSNCFAKSGPGTLIFSNANTMFGAMYIDTSSTTTAEGNVRAAYPGAFGSVTNIQIRDNNTASSTLQLDGTAGSFSSAAVITLSGRNTTVAAIENIAGTNTLSGGININVGGGNYLLQSDAGLLVFSGAITAVVTGNRTFTFQGNGNFLISGSIQNGTATNAVIKTGSGTLTYAGLNTYTNTTTVSAGTLLVNNTNSFTPVTVGSTATLGGRGVLRGPVVIQSNGTLAPGTNAFATALLTVSNTVTLSAGSFTRMKIFHSAQTNDVLRVAGPSISLTYAGTLVLTNLGGTLAAGDTFRLFNATNISGTFSTLTLPALSPGLVWNTTGLTTGSVAVVVSDFGVTASPASITLPAGGNANYTANLAFTNFAGTVTLSVNGLPAGANYTFSQTNVTGSGAVTVSVTTLEAVPTNVYPLTITGVSSSLTRSAPVNLILQHPPVSLVWNATASGEWDVMASTNWLDTNTLANALFYQGDSVLFNDVPGVVTNVDLAAGIAVQPAALTVDASTNTFSIGGAGKITGPTGLVKRGSSVLLLSTTNDYTGDTVVSAGTLALTNGGSIGSATILVSAGALLDASGRLDGTLTLTNGQTLKGNGAVNGNVAVTSGGTLSPGNNSIGVLTLSNSLALAGGSTNFFELNKTLGTNDQLLVGGVLNYGGTLAVTNVSGTLVGGDYFQLFSAAGESGNFSALAGSPGAGLAWKFNPVSGALAVFSTVPPNLGSSVSNNALQLSWPGDHLGWILQVQTNVLNTGLGTNWISLPNSTTNTQFTAPLDPGNGSVFYRLISQ